MPTDRPAGADPAIVRDARWVGRQVALKCLRMVTPERARAASAIMRRYRRKFGVLPNVLRPSTFNEKVIWRMIFDRREILARLQDKYALRAYVKARLGEDILPKLYWVTTDPTDIPIADLPPRFVVKPTHGSGWVYLVPNKTDLDVADLEAVCRGWLAQNYYDLEQEWAYKHIVPRLVVEQFIDDRTGRYPTDYKIYVFHGHAHLIQIDTARFEDHRRDIYDPTWTRLAATSEYKDADRLLPRPKHLPEMIAYAEALAGGLDFIRVDFYDTHERLYLGEATTTPGGGMNLWRPVEFARHMGGLWKLPYGAALLSGIGGRRMLTRGFEPPLDRIVCAVGGAL